MATLSVREDSKPILSQTPGAGIVIARMGLFGSNKKRITEREFTELRSNLYNKLDMYELADLEQTFIGALHERGREAGITQEEFDQGMSWLRKNTKKHHLEESDIELIEEYAREFLKD